MHHLFYHTTGSSVAPERDWETDQQFEPSVGHTLFFWDEMWSVDTVVTDDDGNVHVHLSPATQDNVTDLDGEKVRNSLGD